MRRIARPPLSLLLLVAAAVGCKDRAAPARDDTPPAALPDLSSSLDALRAEFNAHRGESRFLTLLSPT